MVYLVVGLFLRAFLPTVRVCVKRKGKLYFPTLPLPFPGAGGGGEGGAREVSRGGKPVMARGMS